MSRNLPTVAEFPGSPGMPGGPGRPGSPVGENKMDCQCKLFCYQKFHHIIILHAFIYIICEIGSTWLVIERAQHGDE